MKTQGEKVRGKSPNYLVATIKVKNSQETTNNGTNYEDTTRWKERIVIVFFFSYVEFNNKASVCKFVGGTADVLSENHKNDTNPWKKPNRAPLLLSDRVIDELCSLLRRNCQLGEFEYHYSENNSSTKDQKPRSKNILVCYNAASHSPHSYIHRNNMLNFHPSVPGTVRSKSASKTFNSQNLKSDPEPKFGVDVAKNLDVGAILKSITTVQLKVPQYYPLSDGECWYEGFDSWST